jgi:hypothetical protein
MAVLPDEDRERIWRGLMRWWSRQRENVAGCLKADILAAVAATDTWIENNQASYNSSLPATFRANATTAQKTLLFCAVALMRVSLATLRQVFGEVD